IRVERTAVGVYLGAGRRALAAIEAVVDTVGVGIERAAGRAHTRARRRIRAGVVLVGHAVAVGVARLGADRERQSGADDDVVARRVGNVVFGKQQELAGLQPEADHVVDPELEAARKLGVALLLGVTRVRSFEHAPAAAGGDVGPSPAGVDGND